MSIRELGSHARKPRTRAEETVYWFLMGERYAAARERVAGTLRGIITKNVTLTSN